jgi:hypothetical protein
MPSVSQMIAENAFRLALRQGKQKGISSQHFEWLTKQCEFLGITEQELIADVLEEWICRNRPVNLPPDPSAIVRFARSEFMRRHRDEFITVTG